MTRKRERLERRVVRLPDWSSVKVQSCADGSMSVKARWRGVKAWTPEDGGGPGLFTRMSAAAQLQKYLNAALRAARKGEKK